MAALNTDQDSDSVFPGRPEHVVRGCSQEQVIGMSRYFLYEDVGDEQRILDC